MPFFRCRVTKHTKQRVDRASPSQWFSESFRPGALGFPEYPWRSTVQVAGRLVRQQQRWIAHNGARDGDTLLLSAGKLLGQSFSFTGARVDDVEGFRVKLPRFRPNRNGRRISKPATSGRQRWSLMDSANYRAMFHKHSTCSKRRKPSECLPKCYISRTMPHVRGSHRTLTSSTKPLTTAGMSGRRSDVSFPASKGPIRRRTLLTAAVNALRVPVSVEPENGISNTEVL